MPPTLQADSIRKQYPTRTDDLVVLRDVSLTADGGQSVVIMGPSGSGKSTLLNILGTLDRPSAGTVLIDGTDPFQLPERQLAPFRNRHVGFIFQEHHLLPQCNTLENVLLPTLAGGQGNDPLQRAKELLERVGLGERLDHRPSELSGGERQRVAIARALINGPTLLLADEPTGNLDATTAERIADLLSEIHRDQQCALVVVTHSDQLARRFENRMCLDTGTLRRMEPARPPDEGALPKG